MDCLLCGSPTQLRFLTRDHFELMWCLHCQFGRLDGNFTPEQVSSYYDEGYYTHSLQRRPQSSRSLTERALIRLAWSRDSGRDFNPSELRSSGKTVCDIGCGNGNTLRKFQAAGYSTVGIEPDPSAREAASGTGFIYDGTAEILPKLDESFDNVVMSHVLEHCIDPVKAVANASLLLSPQGTLVIEVPNNAALGFQWFQDAWPWSDIPRHLSFFTDISLRRILERNGLKVTNTVYTGYVRQFMPEWRSKISSLWSGWPLLLASAFLPQRYKYDSIRVHAQLR